MQVNANVILWNDFFKKGHVGGMQAGGAALARMDGGAMGIAVREFAWEKTALGPAGQWPPELHSAVALVIESRFPMALVWGHERVTIHNDSFRAILGGKPAALGRGFDTVWAEAWDAIGPLVGQAYAGIPSFFENFPLEVDRGNGPERAWFTFCFSPLRRADGTICGMIDTVIEVTDAVRAREAAEVMRDELAHRLKNTMAMVQSLASRTLRGVTEKDAVKAFEKRVVALGHAHDVLGRGGWQSASLAELADGLLAMHGERFDVKGPEVALGASASVRLALVLHELATNAAKYGALSAEAGRVALHWRVEPGGRGDELVVCWREYDGPAVSEPAHTGFGTRLIDMGLIGTGSVARRYPASGVEVDLRVPVADLAER
ncbi:HWE histidine kinase domain-containing protein [Sphingomonas sp. HF-S4]|uniref:histidine kinase n=1 Tax=Sphingomonas agrestis TaxID=3080540 RepID=A0ABU3Y5Z4_9SPHN|nr:HWE histidine kinase domain-containing protein [Sphingomonas sp. HF-S4]MDV3456746.1 HWE histidine kinase domain-containing protein [Sphingomonas sp. HF-S4]